MRVGTVLRGFGRSRDGTGPAVACVPRDSDCVTRQRRRRKCNLLLACVEGVDVYMRGGASEDLVDIYGRDEGGEELIAPAVI